MTSVPPNAPDPLANATDLQGTTDLLPGLVPDPSHSTISIDVRGACEGTFCSDVALEQPTWVRTGEQTAAAWGDTSSTPSPSEWRPDSKPSPNRVRLDVSTGIESDDEKPVMVNDAGMCCRITMAQGECCKVKPPMAVGQGKDVGVAHDRFE
ncbi:MAG: uncharacterized protein KVP18_000096 [Porospora cf. gigantea A]|uniref:uncharacterized protein n=1 Tax=Porospora cf. gigantea A TaxID=2853593 RepID=UPI003559418E|nr:MAG: hypothetical protein KVP18_000096 [Porospora cf. gigantea A]